ncbi:MAG: PD-(D/E)XK nuclease family protein [Candidatus Sumerlaeota bacterium]|nr:PD-(D/E)XK nuclease family protein [Candidatus Sumerlaeota bacterium]
MTDTKILEALEKGATALTATNRLARAITDNYTARRQKKGQSAWATPDVLSIDAWVRHTWDEYIDSGNATGQDTRMLLLDETLEAMIWEKIISEWCERNERRLMQIPAVAAKAAGAWRLMAEYGVNIDDLKTAKGDAAIFREWAGTFITECDKKQYLPMAQLPEKLCDLLKNNKVNPPQSIIFTGFDEPTPQFEQIEKALKAAGCDVERLEIKGGLGEVVTVNYPDAAAEIEAAAQWARKLLENNEATSIGILVPNLQGERERIERVFFGILHPSWARKVFWEGNGDSAPHAFNISMGAPLASVPVVSAALVALELGSGWISTENAGVLLRSPFFKGAEENAAARAMFDVTLRKNGGLKHPVEPLMECANPPLWEAGRSRRCSWLSDKLTEIAKTTAGFPENTKASPAGWAKHFCDLLKKMGWPHGRKLDNRQFQAVAQWRDLLADYESLARIEFEETYEQALKRLRRMAEEKIFQPAGSAETVQIMGLLEAAGLHFDCLWVMGLHDNAWPAGARHNPFLPLDLQIKRNMHMSTPKLAADFAQRVMERVVCGAGKVILSWPAKEDDRDLRPSPLITKDFTKIESVNKRISNIAMPAKGMMTAGKTEEYQDETGPAVAKGQALHGGTYLVKAQAECPFKAFAIYRLGAEKLEMPCAGLSAMDRGTLVHKALACVWRELKTKACLLSKSDDDLNTLCEEAAKEAIKEFGLPTRNAMLQEIETRRLTGLLREWLELEKQREADFCVVIIEGQAVGPKATPDAEDFTLQLGDVKISGKPDRIDKIADDGLLIIDYKSGSSGSKLGALAEDRPDEPQLPIYARIVMNRIVMNQSKKDNVIGVTFAKLRKGDIAFVGLGETDKIAPGVIPLPASKTAGIKALGTWQNVCDSWKVTLDQLGSQLSQGKAAADPKKDENTCRNCGLKALCRIQEQQPEIGLTYGEEEKNNEHTAE